MLQTIKLTLDSKEQLSILMPKPRYVSTVEYSERNKSKNSLDESQIRDIHDISFKEYMKEKSRLPAIEGANK